MDEELIAFIKNLKSRDIMLHYGGTSEYPVSISNVSTYPVLESEIERAKNIKREDWWSDIFSLAYPQRINEKQKQYEFTLTHPDWANIKVMLNGVEVKGITHLTYIK